MQKFAWVNSVGEDNSNGFAIVQGIQNLRQNLNK